MKQIFILFLFIISLSTQAQTSSDKLIRQGVSLHDKGRYDDAITCYKEALKVNPTSMSAVYEMSLSYLRLKDYNNAILYSTKLIDANFQPLLADAYTVKATALADQNNVKESIKLLNEALDRCGDEYLLHFNLGLTYFNQKETRMALYHLRKTIEIDATRPNPFLLYAYALNDTGRWVQGFYAFHFFLLLEPNTQRSKEVFAEMYDLLMTDIPDDDPRLVFEDGIDRRKLYQIIKSKRPTATDSASQFKYFENASKTVFFALGEMQNDTQSGLLWDFFVPTYAEILNSGYFDTYSRYVSVSHFPESLEWWNNHKDRVDEFIEWFEHGQGVSQDEDDLGDDSDMEEQD